MVLTRDVQGTALVGSHAGHPQVRHAAGHFPQGQLDCVGVWLVQLGFIHYQRVDLSFLWEWGEADSYVGEGPSNGRINFPIDSLSLWDETFPAPEWGWKKKGRDEIGEEWLQVHSPDPRPLPPGRNQESPSA